MQEDGNGRAWGCMDELEKSETPSASTDQQLNPALKSWLDNVLVPALVKLYLEENGVTGDRNPSQDSEKERNR